MAMKIDLSRLERVPLRVAWEREDTGFTPWLAEEENIALLGEAIGIELEIQGQEMNVGPFRADILCRNTEDGSVVIVENQLEATDHSHLGQLLTYAAGLKAATLVWIAASFTEEHRAALDWLNERTDDDFQAFGIEIELWRIGGGPPAPKFNLVAKPNDWSRNIRERSRSASGASTAHEEHRMEFWSGFGSYLKENRARWKPPKPTPSTFVGYGLGRSGVPLFVFLTKQNVAVGVDVKHEDRPGWFRLLLEQRDAIHAELGFEMEWDERPEAKSGSIRIRRQVDTTSQENWPTAFAWILETLDACSRVFRPRLGTLS